MKKDKYLEVSNLDDNVAEEIFLEGRKYKIKRITNAIAERLDKYVAKSRISQAEDPNMLIVNMSKNRKLVPKCLSLILLGSYFKVLFFHPFYWRYLHNTLSQEEMQKLLGAGLEINNVGFFLTSLGFLQSQSKMIARMTTTDSTTILQELSSEKETQSSLNSTEA